MIREVVGALFLGSRELTEHCPPAAERLDRERDAEHEAFLFGLQDLNADFYGSVFPTFDRHHARARSARKL